ncbi:DNA replication/repair protein RecF [Candidatus Berkelbacteria bacterium]|nr:DNA replication/repair protein RecF [Candidatus Berkelbacteria bacterium]
MPLALAELQLSNFRSHRERCVRFEPLTFFLGPNGVGKTNILEAIWVLATTRSFRTRRESDIITWGETTARLASPRWEWALTLEPTLRKLVKIDGRAERPLDYLGSLRAVLFTPETLALVTGPPEERRRFLDMLLAQANRVYAHELAIYRHAVAERNRLLKQIAAGLQPVDVLDAWDIHVARVGISLVQARQTLLLDLAPRVTELYRQITDQPTAALTLTYQPTITGALDDWLATFRKLRERELRFGMTFIGPHRDDFLIDLNGHPAMDFASRGQMRMMSLACKWAECQFLTRADTAAIILLDDVFSELDRHHRQTLLALLGLYQTVCTTTDLATIGQTLPQAQLIELENEVVKEV